MNRLKKEIFRRIDNSIGKLDEEMATWVLEHACFPKEVEAVWKASSGQKHKVNAYAVTEHSGEEDAPFHVVYVPEIDEFGLVQKLKYNDYLEQSQMYFMGTYGDFAEAVDMM